MGVETGGVAARFGKMSKSIFSSVVYDSILPSQGKLFKTSLATD